MIDEKTPFIKVKNKEGRSLTLYQKTCPCGNHFYIRKVVYDKSKYCSLFCASFYRKRRITVKCAFCQKEFEIIPSKYFVSKTGLHFCCMEHKYQMTRQLNNPLLTQPLQKEINEIKDYRRKKIKHSGNICVKCGYHANERMIDIHHKDGNHKNNDLSNLESLCVWCHALLTRKVTPHNWHRTTE